MKKTVAALLVLVIIGVYAPVCFAGKSNTGCGVGTMIMEGKDGLVFQVLAATTNGCFGNQTFGITSGTLECDKPQAMVSNELLKKYVADNMDSIAKDIAKGEGEYLNTLAVLMEVPETSRASFYTTLQTNFGSIYTTSTITSDDVLKNIQTLM